MNSDELKNCQVLSPPRGVLGGVTVFFDISIQPAVLCVSVYLSIKLSSPSIEGGGGNICPPVWEGFHGVQLSESMSEEDGCFSVSENVT